MAQFIEFINKMDVAERLQALEYLCTTLAPNIEKGSPAWHADELHKTEERVATGKDVFMSLEESKRLFAERAYAR